MTLKTQPFFSIFCIQIIYFTKQIDIALDEAKKTKEVQNI